MPDTSSKDTTYRFGCMRGTGRGSAIKAAIPLGLAVAVVLGSVQVLTNPDGPLRWVGVLIFAVFVAPCAIALVWAALVDRRTLPGAVERPEESVENTWYTSAAADSFHIMLAASGLGAFLTSLWLPPEVSWTLMAVFVIGAISCGTCFLFRKSR